LTLAAVGFPPPVPSGLGSWETEWDKRPSRPVPPAKKRNQRPDENNLVWEPVESRLCFWRQPVPCIKRRPFFPQAKPGPPWAPLAELKKLPGALENLPEIGWGRKSGRKKCPPRPKKKAPKLKKFPPAPLGRGWALVPQTPPCDPFGKTPLFYPLVFRFLIENQKRWENEAPLVRTAKRSSPPQIPPQLVKGSRPPPPWYGFGAKIRRLAGFKK